MIMMFFTRLETFPHNNGTEETSDLSELLVECLCSADVGVENILRLENGFNFQFVNNPTNFQILSERRTDIEGYGVIVFLDFGNEALCLLF